MIRTEIDSMPAPLDEITRRVMQLEIEEAALKKEKDKASSNRLAELKKELADLQEKASAMKAQWESEKAAIEHRLPPGTRRSYEEFRTCSGCGRDYWRGAHHGRLERLVAEARDVDT